MKPFFSCLVLMATLASCALTQAEPLPQQPTATTVRVIQTTPLPTAGRLFQAVAPTDGPPTSTPSDCAQNAGRLTRNRVDAVIHYVEKTVEVAQAVSFINKASSPLSEIVFAVEANRFPGALTMSSASVNGRAAPTFELTGRRLTVTLLSPLAPGCSLEIDLGFTLELPAVPAGPPGYTGYFGYTERQLNLGHWLPTVAPRINDRWITHDSIGVGEQVVADVFDWELALKVTDAPEDLQVAAPGVVEAATPGEWRVALNASRDLSLSLSDAFAREQRTSESGTIIELYTIEASNGTARVPGDTAHTLQSADQALTTYSSLFGAYPYERLVIVEGDFHDGMEFSGLVFVSEAWFRTWTGTPQSYLTIITVHEIAHQWWYARIGSDQAIDPWLDEALATYSEYLYYEEYHPELRDWWWNFRVYAYAPRDYVSAQTVDSAVYQFASVREYINAVYLRGAAMLHQLRQDLGREAFFDWLRRYADLGAERIVAADLLWSLLSEQERAQTLETRARYLSQSGGG